MKKISKNRNTNKEKYIGKKLDKILTIDSNKEKLDTNNKDKNLLKLKNQKNFIKSYKKLGIFNKIKNKKELNNKQVELNRISK